MIEIQIFEVERDAVILKDMKASNPAWLAREIRALDNANLIRPGVGEMQAFLESQGFTYEIVHRERTYNKVRPAPSEEMERVTLITCLIRFENDAEGIYFKMWQAGA